jgi:Mitochondrial carrier protein
MLFPHKQNLLISFVYIFDCAALSKQTILQNSHTETVASLMKPSAFHRLTIGAGANFLLSVPHGAVNFAVLEFVRCRLGALVASNPALQKRSGRWGPTLDFASSAISTIVCSVVSTPQMMITDNIMAGNFNNLPQAIAGLASRGGVVAFYRGWWPGLVGKIPSYALTWTLFQELKVMRDRLTHHRPATNIENAIMGCLASATTVTIMIPLDTIKTRLVTQGGSAVGSRVYKGIIDCAVRVAREEGIKTFYRGLPPRLASVVPMIGIQFGVYEAMKNVMLKRTGDGKSPEKKFIGSDNKEKKEGAVPVDEPPTSTAIGEYDASQVFEEAAMEVAASPEQPYPAPQFLKKRVNQKTLEQTEKTLQDELSRKPWKKVLKLQR